MNFNNDEKDVLFTSLNAIIKDYDEEYIWTAVFIVKPIVESQEFEQAIKEEK